MTQGSSAKTVWMLNSSLSRAFFISSRRRHTRCLSDWSSDVCSSDLTAEERRQENDFKDSLLGLNRRLAQARQSADGQPQKIAQLREQLEKARLNFEVFLRSEERRVGKECRYRQNEEPANDDGRRQHQ